MFDIIVVTYNSGEKLKTTLDSIYAQDFWDYRVVIKDGASTDGSLSNLCDSGYFDEFRSARTTIIVAPDKGIYDAMNVAVESLRSGASKGARVTEQLGQTIRWVRNIFFSSIAETPSRTGRFSEM